ncbi:hypothetical protein D3C84_750850 [compost metagenome]|jgi:hypothetical protein
MEHVAPRVRGATLILLEWFGVIADKAPTVSYAKLLIRVRLVNVIMVLVKQSTASQGLVHTEG